MHLMHLPLEIDVDVEVGVALIKQRIGDHPEEVIQIEISRDQAISVADFLIKSFKVRKSEVVTGDDTGFDEFWKAYPTKEGKQTALAVWKRDNCSAVLGKIMADIERRMQSKQWKEGYIPHATTYLRQKRYSDDQTVLSSNPWDNAL